MFPGWSPGHYLASSPALVHICMSTKTIFDKTLVYKNKGIWRWPWPKLCLPEYPEHSILLMQGKLAVFSMFFQCSFTSFLKNPFSENQSKGLKEETDWRPTNQLDLKWKFFCSLFFFFKEKKRKKKFVSNICSMLWNVCFDLYSYSLIHQY